MSRHSLWRPVALIAAVYVYFLLFAEFAFLELVLPVTGETGLGLRMVMGALAAGGIAGSVVAARRIRPLAGWLVACGGAAALALLAGGLGITGLAVAGWAVGFALGGATVSLAAGLREACGERLGVAAGLGTGVAYALCNVPCVFEASPSTQTLGAAIAVLAAAGLGRAWRTGVRETTAVRGAGAWTCVFLALVWMDSAAFYIIQHTAELKAGTWIGSATLWGNALVHLLAAVVAGAVLDRGQAVWVVVPAGAALAAACAIIPGTGGESAYVAGVSLYSTALVYVAAKSGDRRAAALIFAVAGWGGSALGIGMAQDLHGIPAWFAPAAFAALCAGLVWRRRCGGALAVLALFACVIPNHGLAADEAISRGREVYLAEGCIHCHSQYVRPGTEDVERWGPARSLDVLLAELPPLPGNRRQGPDLLNVGNRRSRDWNRAHLIAPRAVSPGSRMPSYAHLFGPGLQRGEDLIAYLAELGAGTESERAATAAAWRPEPTAPADAKLGHRLYARSCLACHGESGKGDGPLAHAFTPPPADLTRPTLDRDRERLARLIKFGRPGTAMAGHETLTDAEVVSLALYAAELASASHTP